VRKFYEIPSFSGGVDFAPINTNIDELERGVTERLIFVKRDGEFLPPPGTTDTIVFEKLGVFAKTLDDASHGYTKLSKEKFLQHYSGPKRARYERASRVLRLRPLRRNDAHKKTFVKYEKTNWTSKKDPVPRIINPPSFEYAYEYGRYVKPVEKKIYASINRIYDTGTPVVMKGLNQRERGVAFHEKWKRFTNPVALMFDQKRFDQHVSVSCLKWCHKRIESYYRHDKYLRMLHSWQLDNVGKGRSSDGFISYRVQGGLMSGEMNTSLVAVMIICGIVYSFMRAVGIEKFDLADDGDDCVVILEKDDVARFMNRFSGFCLELGFEVEIEKPVYNLEDINFCQSNPVFDGSDWVMCRGLSSLSKDSVSLVHWNNPNDAMRWMAAIGKCGLSIAARLPIFQSYYNAYVRCSLGAKPFDHVLDYGMELKSQRMDRTVGAITDCARVSFWKAFGVCPDDQRTCELYYDSLRVDVSVINTDRELTRVLPC